MRLEQSQWPIFSAFGTFLTVGSSETFTTKEVGTLEDLYLASAQMICEKKKTNSYEGQLCKLMISACNLVQVNDHDPSFGILVRIPCKIRMSIWFGEPRITNFARGQQLFVTIRHVITGAKTSSTLLEPTF